MNVWTCLVTDSHNLSNVPGSCECFDKHKKFCGEVSLHSHMELYTLGFSKCPNK